MSAVRYTAAKRRQVEAARRAAVEAELRADLTLPREELAARMSERLVFVNGVTRTGEGDLTLDEVVDRHLAALAVRFGQ